MENNNKGTRAELRTWLNKSFGITYTHWKRLPRERRLSDYKHYQKGTNPN